VVPLAASFDTVGWFARSASMMRRVGTVLLPQAKPFVPRRLLIAADAFASVEPPIAAALAPAIDKVAASVSQVARVKVYTGDSAEWRKVFSILQGAEIWAQHGTWINRYKPEFGPGIRERFAWTATITAHEVAAAIPARDAVARHIEALLGDDAMLCLPTAPGIAPWLKTPPAQLEAFRANAFALLSIAGLARLPQISLPLGTSEGCPIGLSVIGPRRTDQGMLDWVAGYLN
jgi:amidase